MSWVLVVLLLLVVFFQSREMSKLREQNQEQNKVIERLRREQIEQYQDFYKEEVWTIG